MIPGHVSPVWSLSDPRVSPVWASCEPRLSPMRVSPVSPMWAPASLWAPKLVWASDLSVSTSPWGEPGHGGESQLVCVPQNGGEPQPWGWELVLGVSPGYEGEPGLFVSPKIWVSPSCALAMGVSPGHVGEPRPHCVGVQKCPKTSKKANAKRISGWMTITK